MKIGLPRKKKKKAKKKMALLFKKMIPLIAKLTYDTVIIADKITEARIAMNLFISALKPFNLSYLSDPITRCDRLLTLKG